MIKRAVGESQPFPEDNIECQRVGFSRPSAKLHPYRKRKKRRNTQTVLNTTLRTHDLDLEYLTNPNLGSGIQRLHISLLIGIFNARPAGLFSLPLRSRRLSGKLTPYLVAIHLQPLVTSRPPSKSRPARNNRQAVFSTILHASPTLQRHQPLCSCPCYRWPQDPDALLL